MNDSSESTEAFDERRFNNNLPKLGVMLKRLCAGGVFLLCASEV